MRVSAPQVRPSDPLARAAELMATFSVRELAVVENGAVVGIVARSDLHPHTGYLEWTPVRVAMTAHPKTVAPDTPLRVVANAMLAGSFNAIPVVEHGRLAGMISRQDVIRLLAEQANNAEA